MSRTMLVVGLFAMAVGAESSPKIRMCKRALVTYRLNAS